MMKRNIIHIALLLVALLMSANAFAQTEISGTWAGGTLKGSYKLTNNTTLTNTITVASGQTLTIDLNGMVLSGNGNGAVITVNSGGKCTIKDSNPSVGHACSVNSSGLLMWPAQSGQTTKSVYGGIIYNSFKNEDTNTKGISVSGECEIESGKIMGCYSTDLGAAVSVTSSGKFTMGSGEISYNVTNCKKDHERAGIIYGNEPSNNNSGSYIQVSNTIICNNTSYGNGGAIYGWKVSLDNCDIHSNTCSKNGGGVYLHSYQSGNVESDLTISNNTKINDNIAEISGGGIYVAGGKLSISDSEISSNDAKGKTGGGIHVQNADITITSSKINGNEALGSGSQGGGIYVNGDPTIYNCNISTSEINKNYSSSNGGGIYSKIPTKVSDSDICWNRTMTSRTAEQITNGGRGGGFHFTGEIECELYNTNVDYNAAMWYGGGGQIDNKAKLTLKGNSTINHNTAVLHGAGGLHLTSEAHLVLESGEISYNEVSTVGGGIHTSYGCFLELNGGRITNNIAHQRGGGVHVNTGGDLVLNGTDILGNKVYKGYDILYSEVIRNSDGTYTWSTPVADTATSSYELDAEGKLVDSGYGGGVLIDSGTCTMNSGSLSGNYAEKAGGGLGLIMIRMSDDVDDFAKLKVVSFTLNNGTISNNTCDGNGAGVYLMRNKMPDMFAKLSSDAQETLKQDPNYSILINGVPTATIAQGTFSENDSDIAGGAIMMEKGNFTITGNTKLENNKSTSHGGGIYIGGGTFRINQSGSLTAQGNQSSSGNGGAIYLGDGTFTSAGSVTLGNESSPNNAANGNGGGIYCAGAFSMTGGAQAVINNNTAKNGGALYATGNVTFTGNTNISNNIATADGGAIYVQGGSITASEATLSSANNKAVNGGVFYVNNGSVTLGNATMTDNTASSNGGAIALYNGAFGMGPSSNIRNNKAENFGGGLYVYNAPGSAQKSISCTGGTFSVNTAKAGGAVCADGNIQLTLAASMESNTANIGGGIYMANGVQMTFGEGLIRSNTANAPDNSSYTTASGKDLSNVSGVGGGIFMGDNSKLTFTSTEMGIYNNFATNAGADICANGNTTSIVLPNITQMSLKGFRVPGNQLYWVEDYFTGDTGYTNTNDGSLKGIRYEDALKIPGFDISKYIINYAAGETVRTIDKYICLDLGYDLVFVTFSVNGLLMESDNVSITMSYPEKNSEGNLTGNNVQYRKILITGNTSRMVGLPSGDWKIASTEWDYKYEEPTLAPSHNSNGYISVKRTGINDETNGNLTITATFSIKNDMSDIKSFETRKVNRMTL